MVFKRIRAKAKTVLGLEKIPWPEHLSRAYFKNWPRERKKGTGKKLREIPNQYRTKVFSFRWNNKSLRLGENFIKTFPTAELENYSVKIIMTSHESPVGLELLTKSGEHQAAFAQCRLNFSKIPGYGKSVLIEAFQGHLLVRKLLSKFYREAKMPWANYMTQKTIEHAKNMGFKAVGILDPRCHFYYWSPAGSRRLPEEVQESMLKIYLGTAKNMGFDVEHPVITKNAIYYMKKL